ncbi:MAG: hypothetical protein V4642_16520 [Bacteroidota bacterium]
MKKNSLLIAAALVATLASCDRRPENAEEAANLQKPADTMTVQTSAEDARFAEESTTYYSSTDQRIAMLDARMDSLEARTGRAKGAEKTRLQARYDALKMRRDSLNTNYSGLRAATRDAWGNLKTGVDNSIDAIEREFNELKIDLNPNTSTTTTTTPAGTTPGTVGKTTPSGTTTTGTTTTTTTTTDTKGGTTTTTKKKVATP